MANRSHLSIGEVLSLLQGEFPDVTISKIRFLESQGLVDPERTPSGYRKFYEDDIERLRWVLRQQRDSFLPLKVIKGQLDRVEDEEEGDVGGTSQPSAPSSQEEATTTSPVSLTAPTEAPNDEVEARRGPTGRHHEARSGADLGLVSTVERSGTGQLFDVEASYGALGGYSTYSGRRRSSGSGSRSWAPGGTGTDPRGTGVAMDERAAATALDQHEEAGHDEPAALRVPAAPTAARRRRAGDGKDRSAQPSAAKPAATGPADASAAGNRSSTVLPGPRGYDPGDELTLDELANAAGVEVGAVRDLEMYGLISARVIGGTSYYGQEALTVAQLAGAFARHGVEARHLRAYKSAAEREAGIVQQVVMPLIKQRNPEARRVAAETADELAELGGRLRAALLSAALSTMS